MQVFYSNTIQGSQILLSEEEAHHAIKVMRLTAGQEISITNGEGKLFLAHITGIGKQEVAAEIISTQEFPKRKAGLHIAIAPTKNNDRFEWFLEKAVEFGIERITPIICERSERKELNTERMRKILVAAAKQSLHFHFPVLEEAVPFKKWIAQNHSEKKMIAHCIESDKKNLFNEWNLSGENLVLIGPEGDFSPNEIELAIQNNFIPVSLGNSRLRTETAGIAVAHELALKLVQE